MKFDSKKEARRWRELKRLFFAGKIGSLSRQVRIPLRVGGVKIGKIVMDFVYVENGMIVYEDVKSKATITPMFKWKARHFAAQFGQEIRVHL